MTAFDDIRALQRENDALKERIQDLEAELSSIFCDDADGWPDFLDGVPLCKGERLVMRALLRRPGECVPKDGLMYALEAAGSRAENSRIVYVYVNRIRDKLRVARSPAKIQTIWGRGFIAEVPT